jgi:hypothetical protein
MDGEGGEKMKHEGTMAAKVIQVIETKALRGEGVEGDPVRDILQYWTLDGRLIAEWDPVTDGDKEPQP